MSKLRRVLVFVFVFIFVAFVSASVVQNIISDVADHSPSNYIRQVSINGLIDDNLEDIQNGLAAFDPAKMADIPLQSKGALTNGLVHKLSKMHRGGPCTLQYSDKVLKVDLYMGWDDIKYDYDYTFKLLFIERHGKLHGGVNKLKIHISLQVDFKNYLIVLEKLKFTEIGKLDLELEGTIGDRWRSLIGKLILNIAKNRIIDTIEKVATDMVEKKLKELNERIPHHNNKFIFVNLAN